MSEIIKHIDRPITIEAAKLLGVAFTWSSSRYVYRFVPADGGLVVERRGRWDGEPWHEITGFRSADEFEVNLDQYLRRQGEITFLVTFSDDEVPTC